MKLTFKKIYATLLLSLCAFLPAVGQAFQYPTLPTDGSLHQVDVLVEEESVTIDFSQLESSIKEDMMNFKINYLHFYFVDNGGNPLETKINVQTENKKRIESDVDCFFYESNQYSNILNQYNLSDNINKFTIPKPEGKTWSEIKLIAIMTDDTDGYAYSNNTVTSIPKNIKSYFEFSFKTKEQIEEAFEFPDLSKIDTDKKHSFEILVKDGQTATISISSEDDMYKALKTDFSNNIGDITYFHFYLVDTDGEPIKNGGITTTTSSSVWTSSNGLFAYNQYGYLINYGVSVSVTLPEGKAWKDVKLIAVFANNADGFSQQGNVIVSGPTTFGSCFEFTIKKETFRHYEGIANNPGTWDTTSGHNMQYTNEYSYEKFALEGEEINLVLPFVMGDDLEPKGYIRWYNYDTDGAIDDALLNRAEYGKDLKPLYDEDGKTPKGLFAWNIARGQNKENVAALKFKAPDKEAWKNGEGCITIACDVSRYSDGMDALTTDGTAHLIHEPTLSMRYIFKIRPAKYIADAIKNAILNNQGGTYEDNGNISICTDAVLAGGDNGESNNSSASLRLRLQELKDYYFYEYKLSNKNNPAPTADDFVTDKVYHATGDSNIEWRIFNQAGSHYKIIDPQNNYLQSGLMCKISPNIINSANSGKWIATEGTTTSYTAKFRVGNMAYVIAYLKSGDKFCPVARFSCRFQADTAPMDADQVKSTHPERTVDYLKQYYDEVAVLSFDNHDPTSGLAAPTGPLANMTGRPISWGLRYYGYVYKDLYDKMIDPVGNYWNCGLTPIHGEYCLYKTANLDGVSKGNVTDVNTGKSYIYNWYSTGENNPPFYDRTYYLTNHAQSGFFLYIDASDESRQIASVAFDGELCAGSTLVVSAAVADLTSQNTKPQLMFKLYGVVEEGGKVVERKLIQTIASGDFASFTDKPETGKWYQVFCRTSIQQGTGAENYTRFHVVIDNYCNGTQGADYAIDDIRIFTRNAKAEVVQKTIPCGDEEKATFKIRILQSTLINWLGSETHWINWSADAYKEYGYKYFYYQIRSKKTGQPVENVTYRVVGADEDKTAISTSNDWGRSRVVRVYNNRPLDVDDNLYETIGSDLYSVMEETIVLTVPEDDDEYYVALALPIYGSGATSGPDGNKGEKTAQLTGPDDSSWGHPDDLCSAYSEYFTIRRQELSITNAEGDIVPGLIQACTGNSQYELKAALQVPDPVNGGTTTIKDLKYTWYVVDKDEQQIGEDAIAKDVEGFNYTINSEHIRDGYIYFKLVPSEKSVDFTDGTGKTVTVAICTDPITAKLRVLSGGPKLTLGFPEVSYPSSSDTRVVRLGLEQIKAIESTSLKIPIYNYEGKSDTGSAFNLKVQSKDLVVSGTTDPTCTVGTKIGTVTSLDGEFLQIKFEENIHNSLHEGYEYEVHFQIHKDGDTCLGDVYFLMKIVPEYVTWTGRDDNGNSTNWNNDGNWRRSSKEEIYKDDTYIDYGTGTMSTLSQEENYVPMKFTKVTMPANIQAPYLTALSANNNEDIIDTNLSPNEAQYHATTDIQYDLMVKVELTNGAYECEKFYGNTCKEIYFKPQAELRHQENLTYERAWVEYELVPNKWYTLTSPLKDVYAGDMYVPESGRQETEAFEEINFDTEKDYSRTTYPIYQRSWDRAEAKVIANTGYHGDNYDATIDYTSWGGTSANDEANVVASQWSHTYNDVTVPYTPDGTNQNGFSLRANKKDVEGKALIRIPKADDSYTYYNYNDEAEESKQGTVTKDTGTNLLMDNSTATTVTMPLKNESKDNGLYLVSNPYMASIDMGVFFRENSHLLKQYWIILRGESYALLIDASEAENTTVDPTQAFFVKKATGSTVDKVTFTPDMMTNKKVDVDGYVLSKLARHTEAKAALAATRSAVMKASYGDKQSSVKVLLKDDADEAFVENEDVETLYDSNLADVPTLYTIAGDQAVSVNVLPEVRVMPVGIVCSEDVTATLQLTRNNTGADLYLFDRKTGKTTLLTDSTDVAMQANEHGRYYLTRGVVTKINEVSDERGVKCYSPAPGLLTVTCLSSGDIIETIDLYTIDGKKLQSVRGVDNVTTTLHTYKGIKVAVVKHTGNDQAEAVKVAVR